MKMFIRIALLSSLLLSGSAQAANYKIDSDHSSVGFKVRHLAISSVNGSFTDFQGTFSFDPANPASAKVEAKVSPKSVNTSQAKRDDHLRSPDFFDAAKYPEATFVSRQILNPSKTGFQVLGDLTLRGVTKPVTLDVKFEGAAKDPYGNERAAFTATTTINRKDWGLAWNKVLETGALVVGEEVNITLQIEGIKQA